MTLTAVGAYVYAGGFSVGVERAGFDVLCHLEGDNAYGVSTAQLNWPDRPMHYGPSRWPLQELSDRQIDLVYSNPPCAIFSMMGITTTRGQGAWRDDPRLEHWWDSVRVLETVKPRFWCLESVTQAYTRGREVIDEITKRSLMLGYSVSHIFVDARWHGLPQARKRFFIAAHRPARLVGYAPSRNWSPPPTIGEAFETVSEPGWSWQAALEAGRPDLVKLLEDTRPGELLANVWDRQHPEVKIVSGVRTKGRPSFRHRRLAMNEVMGAYVSGDYYHPTENRVLGINESKAICGYPPDFKLAPPEKEGPGLLARAVMPPVAEWLARAAAATLGQADGHWEDRRVTLVDVREPDRPEVDLTREYLDERGKVRLRMRSDGSLSYAVYTPTSVSVGGRRPAPAPVVPATVEPAPAVTALIEEQQPLGEPFATILHDNRYELYSRSEPSLADAFNPADPAYKAQAGEGSGKLIKRLWRETTLSPDQLVSVVHANWSGRTTRVGDIYYNYKQMIAAAEPVRPWPGQARPQIIVKEGIPHPRQPQSVSPCASTGEVQGGAVVPPVRAPSGLAERSTVVPLRRGSLGRALLYFSKLPEMGAASPISSARIAWFLQQEIQFDAVYHAKAYSAEVVPERISELWVVNSSWMWMKDEWRRISMRLFAVADRVIFCQNDYALYINSYHLGVMRDETNYVLLTTAPETPVMLKHEMRPHLVNWNVLTYLPRPETDAERRDGLYYYGSFRTGRSKIFDRYLADPPERLVVSASNGEDVRKFQEAYPRLNVVGRSDDVFAELERWRATLLLEDDKAASIYVSPPNRFYESLSTRTPMIFDRTSIEMFGRYGYDIRGMAADGPRDLNRLLDRAEEIGEEQQGWHRDYLAELRTQLAEARQVLERGELGRRGAPGHLKRYQMTEDGGTF